MEIRPQFLNFVAARTGLQAAEIEQGAVPVDMVAGSEAERGLGNAFKTMTEFLRMSQSTAVEMKQLPPADPRRNQCWQILYQEMRTPTPQAEGERDPSSPYSVLSDLQQTVMKGLGYPASYTRCQAGPDGTFSVDLVRRPVDAREFEPDSARMKTMKGVLFVDSTPGQPGGVAYLHRVAPDYPRPSVEEARALHDQVQPHTDRVRPQVKALLEALRAGTKVQNEQARAGDGRLYFFSDDRGQRVGALRIDAPTVSRSLTPRVAGVHSFGDDARVSLLPDPSETYTEEIELNGEERKAVLEALFAVKPRADADSRDSLSMATSMLEGIVADGNLGFYDQTVRHYGDGDSWLSRLRGGKSVTLG